MSVVKRLAAATVFAAALFAAPAPAEAQSGCELLYLKWEGCATECDSYYESTVLRAVCRGWCLVEYLYDYWTCESNVEGAASEEEDDEGETAEEEPVALLLRDATRHATANAPPVGETGPTTIPGIAGARRAVFRRTLFPRCAESFGSSRRVARGRAPEANAPAPPGPIPDAAPVPSSPRRATGTGTT